MPNFNEHTFENGFRLAWHPTQSQTIFANLRINHGALHEIEGEEGTAHLLEHMFIEGGTAKYAPAEFDKIRDNFGYTNANTSRDCTNIPFGMLDRQFETYLDLASQMAFYQRLDPIALAQQKETVLREISKMKGQPDFEDMTRFFWPTIARDREHSYVTIGKEEVVRNATESTLRAFHARGYSPNNMVLTVAGNTPLDIIDLVGSYFASQPIGPGRPIEFHQVPALEKQSVRYSPAPDLINRDHPSESNSLLKIGIVVPDEFHQDSAALLVASEILGGSWTYGLLKRIRREEGLAYNIGSSYYGDRRMGYFGIGGKVLARKQEKAIDIAFEEMHRIGTDLVDADELERAKMRAAYYIANNVDGRFNKVLSIDPTNTPFLAKMEYFIEGRPSVCQVLENISSVSREDVLRVGSQYIPQSRESGKYVMLVRNPLAKA